MQPSKEQLEKTSEDHQPKLKEQEVTKEGNPVQKEEKLPPASPEVTRQEAAKVKSAAQDQNHKAGRGTLAKQEGTKTVLVRGINADGDLAMMHIQVPLSDKRPAVKIGQRITQDDRVLPGNPGKNGNGPIDFDE